MHTYGFDIQTLDSLTKKPSEKKMARGLVAHISAPDNEYALKKISLRAGKECRIYTEADQEAAVFVEEGCVRKNNVEIAARHMTFFLPPFSCARIRAEMDSVMYIFYGLYSGNTFKIPPKIQGTQDKRQKYWGSIETIINRNITGKRLFFKKGKNSSLHFHCSKKETYFIHSGKLLVRLRAGRGDDRFFTLVAGSTLFIPPGLMHQDGGLEDTVIIEISTHDEDSDSFIVEDGEKHAMPRLRRE